jgi:hypothetical protein
MNVINAVAYPYSTKILSIKLYKSLDLYDWSIDATIAISCNEYSSWCHENYPNQYTYFNKEYIDPVTSCKFIDVYIRFQPKEALVHFLLSNNANTKEHVF